MELVGLVFACTFEEGEPFYGVVCQVKGSEAKIRPLPCVVGRYNKKVLKCSPNWDKLERTIKTPGKFMWARIATDGKKPRLEAQGKTFELYGLEDEVHLFKA